MIGGRYCGCLKSCHLLSCLRYLESQCTVLLNRMFRIVYSAENNILTYMDMYLEEVLEMLCSKLVSTSQHIEKLS
jgi:hypothetical protein